MGLIYTVPQAHALVIERFGKFNSVQREGINFKLPFIDNIKYVSNWGSNANKKGFLIELSEQQTDTPPRQCHTKDNVSVNANASVYWRIIDIRKAVYEVDVLPTAISDIALNALRSNIGLLTLDQILSERQSLNEKISAQLKNTADKWGVQFTRVEIQELTTSDETAEAMRQEMTAERKKKAIIAEAEGQANAELKIAEAQARAILLKAQGEAAALLRIADAESQYLEKLKKEVDPITAGQILIAQKYILGMDTISKNPSDKVFLPNNFQALFSLPANKIPST